MNSAAGMGPMMKRGASSAKRRYSASASFAATLYVWVLFSLVKTRVNQLWAVPFQSDSICELERGVL